MNLALDCAADSRSDERSMNSGPELIRDKISMISDEQPRENEAMRILAWGGSNGYLSISRPSGVIVLGPLRAPRPARVWNAAPTASSALIRPSCRKGRTSFTTWVVDVFECEWILVHGDQLQNGRREVTPLDLWRIEINQFVKGFFGE